MIMAFKYKTNRAIRWILLCIFLLYSCDFQMIYEYNVVNDTENEIVVDAKLISYNRYTAKQIATTIKANETKQVYIHSPDFFCDKHDFAERLDSLHWNFYYFKVIIHDTIEQDFTMEDNWDFISEERLGKYILTISNN